MSKIYSLLLTLALCPFTNAQDTTGKQLNEVVITTNKYPKKQSTTGKVISVINTQTLQQMSGKTVSEILNTVAGVTINGANNNLGTNQGVSIRGASFGNTLILIDGIPVNDPSLISNYFDLNFINRNDIERIEILKGGQSTLYGSDAVAGVINIITRKSMASKTAINAGVQYGSYQTFNANAGINGSIKKLSYQLQGASIFSKGFSSAHDAAGNNNFDRDDYKQNMAKADFRYLLTDAAAVRLFGNYSHYNAAIDAAAFKDDRDYYIKNKNAQTGVGFTWTKAAGNLQFNYHFNYINRHYLNDSAHRSDPDFYFIKDDYNGKTHYTELYKTFKFKNWEVLAGADYRYNNASNKTIYVYKDFFTGMPTKGSSELADTLANAWQLSPYASVVFNKSNFNIEVGGRWNYHNEYGNNFTYTFNPSYLINNKIKIFANASSAFKAPSLYQLFAGYIGYKNLKPETSDIVEGGIEWYWQDKIQVRTTGFLRRTKNAIQYIIINPTTYESGYRNISSQKNNGAEVEVNFNNNKWNINANYTYTQGKTTTNYSETGFELPKDTTYNSLYRVPKNAFNIFASYNFTTKLNTGVLLRYIGNRLEPVYAAAPQTLQDYYTIDISASYSFNKNIKTFVDLKNITNEKYFDVLGYNSRRFNWNAGIYLQY